MNTKVLRSLSYGVYITATMDGQRPTGCITNSVMQITSSPATVAVSVNHDNYTNGCIEKNGFFAVSILAGMAVGGAVGQNVVGMMNNAMNPTNIPPVPTLVFYLAVSGKATGPYDIETLKKMKLAGQFNESSLIWKEGMLEWKKASDVTEVASVFSSGMPEIPSE